ncbi:hypothetical protein M011DRAFT_474467 [Sporormia fimetaria CBS 119925]|uniref:t-SNARE coiled-coil homology domain-containing protein n=1 Tax=Sporormia fimetaria CBS 119925 TaxID=1340428 RepID=A0A6A6VP83_9PLEO|nr:hypothetical protein M011DRAFT_474467 [Sporormia fimetaria CBS 119925]
MASLAPVPPNNWYAEVDHDTIVDMAQRVKSVGDSVEEIKKIVKGMHQETEMRGTEIENVETKIENLDESVENVYQKVETVEVKSEAVEKSLQAVIKSVEREVHVLNRNIQDNNRQQRYILDAVASLERKVEALMN